jgi:hypothetical protein
MRKFSKKGAVIFGAALAVCAFVMPSMASALSWGTVGSAHTLTATNLGFIVHTTSGTAGSTCKDVNFTSNVATAARLTITAATFSNCTGQGALGTSCGATAAPTGLPWSATGVTTNNVQIHAVDIDVAFTGACALANTSSRVTGTLTSGTWTGNGAGQHSVNLNTGAGLSAHTALGTFPITITGGGLVVDRQQTLTLS